MCNWRKFEYSTYLMPHKVFLCMFFCGLKIFFLDLLHTVLVWQNYGALNLLQNYTTRKFWYLTKKKFKRQKTCSEKVNNRRVASFQLKIYHVKNAWNWPLFHVLTSFLVHCKLAKSIRLILCLCSPVQINTKCHLFIGENVK